MKITSRNAVSMAMVVMLLSGAASSAEEVKVGIHSDTGDCSVCHVAPEARLRGWFVFGSTKREMKDDLNTLCLKCHKVEPVPDGSLGIGIGHATGKKTAINHNKLPLSSDGTINCATTCHNMHVTSDNLFQQRRHLRLPDNSLCAACHDT